MAALAAIASGIYAALQQQTELQLKAVTQQTKQRFSNRQRSTSKE
jgi:hypothetical protein